MNCLVRPFDKLRVIPSSIEGRKVFETLQRLLTCVLVFVTAFASGCKSSDSPTAPSDPSVGLNIPFSAADLVVGTGTEATNGRNVTLQYTLWLYHPTNAENKGRQVDAGTYTFVLGTGNAIQGWHQGIPGMRIGGRRRLVIPPNLAYGAAGAPPDVPGNATILFEVNLLNVQ
jgi:FKBP-type peptidyl-prolyl cis-trans isomerase FkpA